MRWKEKLEAGNTLIKPMKKDKTPIWDEAMMVSKKSFMPNGTELVKDKPAEDWEKEFDKLYEAELLNRYGSVFKKTVKDFIRQLLEKEEANWMAEIHEQIDQARKEEYKRGHNDCLKELGKVGEKWQGNYL